MQLSRRLERLPKTLGTGNKHRKREKPPKGVALFSVIRDTLAVSALHREGAIFLLPPASPVMPPQCVGDGRFSDKTCAARKPAGGSRDSEIT